MKASIRSKTPIRIGARQMSEDQWIIRPYSEGDETRVFDLWKTVWPTNCDQARWLAWWKWSHFANPAGGEIFVAEMGEKIIGYVRVMFVDAKVHDRIIRAHQGCDFMTDPSYRGRGIGLELVKQQLAAGERAGAMFAYVFPTDTSYRLWKRHVSNWFEVGNLEVAIKPIHWKTTLQWGNQNSVHKWSVPCTIAAIVNGITLHTISRRLNRGTLRTRTIVTQVNHFDDRIDALWKRVSERFKIMIVRSERYLNWRFNPPGKLYRRFIAEEDDRITGYTILQDHAENGFLLTYIVELIAESEIAANSLVSRIIEDCTSHRTDIIVYPAISRLFNSVLKRNGFILNVPFIKRSRLCVYPHSDAPRELLAEQKNWFVQIGDSDFCTLVTK